MKFFATIHFFPAALAFSVNSNKSSRAPTSLHASLHVSRRDVIATAALALPSVANAAAAVQDSLEIDEFLRTGVDSGGNMGVSSQAGKSRPQTGVVFRDGTDVLQSKTGDVSAEILVGTKADPKSVLISFSAPYKLETGGVFDVECRDQKTGDGAFLAVTEKANGKSLEELDSSFFMQRLFDPTGRFSFYGPPTDVKVKKSTMVNGQRLLEVSFSNLSQSTNAEIPRNAVIMATIPKGTDNAVMLVASANASRWKKGADFTSRAIVDSFSAIPSPKTSLKLRAKDRSGGASIDF
ncbi:hypothetical protein ACHAXM_010811 [Skeletonema potamos]|jgi:hypothetical protein